MGKGPRYYAIKSGWQTGVFHTDWNTAKQYIEGYSKAVYKGFDSRAAAEHWVGAAAAQRSDQLPTAEGQDATAAPRRERSRSPPQPRPRLPNQPQNPLSRTKKPPTQNHQPLHQAIPESGAYRLEFDGGSRGNGNISSVAGYGFAIFSPTGQQVAQQAGPMPPGCTNNEAEYTALVRGLEAALKLGVKHMHVKGDSNLVVQQVQGNWKVGAQNLQPLHARVLQLSREFDFFKVDHVLRHLNTTADALSNQGMDLASVLCRVARSSSSSGSSSRQSLVQGLQQVVQLSEAEAQCLLVSEDLMLAAAQVLPTKCGASSEELLQFAARCRSAS